MFKEINIYKKISFLLIIILILGIFFRFVNLEQKVYWFNEVHTTLNIFGYDNSQIKSEIYNNKLISVEEIQKFQKFDEEKSFIDALKIIAINAEHTPLYYLMARQWAMWFGSSVAVMRSLPAFLSLLVFPSMYWLSKELFRSSTIAWMATILTAISPILVRYAQEAREYSLWTVTILLSSAAFLRAIRLNTKETWKIYILMTALSLYTHWFTILVLISQGIYLLINDNFRLTKVIKKYLHSTLISLIIFSPWIVNTLIFFSRTLKVTKHLTETSTLSFLGKNWGVNLAHLFFASTNPEQILDIFLVIPVLLLISYSTYLLCRQTNKHIWLFILILMGFTAAFLVLPDLILGGVRSIRGRYLLPSYIGIQLTVAYCLTTQSFFQLSKVKRRIWQIITLIVISGGIVSCAINSQATTWWGLSLVDVEIADIIKQTKDPIIITDIPYGVIAPLSNKINANTKFVLVGESSSLELPDQFSTVFLYQPSTQLYQEISKNKNIKMNLIYQKPREDLTIYSLYQLQY